MNSTGDGPEASTVVDDEHKDVKSPKKEDGETEETEDSNQKLRIAVVGCSHGELNKIYDMIVEQEKSGEKIDLLLCCGDFQAMRNAGDLEHFHCPPKYRQLGDFAEYYSKEKTAAVLTVLVAGNHESVAYKMELPYGGWLAPNIYYLGFASVVNFGGLRIGGWTGIYKENDYNFTHYEAPPFARGQHISSYHVRSIERFRLGLLDDEKPNCVDIFLTHDWPVGITDYGNKQWLIRHKPYFEADINNGCLGNPHSMSLLKKIRPRHWFSAHLHVKFAATIEHKAVEKLRTQSYTNFLALHKCDSRRPNKWYYEILTVDAPNPLSKELRYDPTWLAILRKTSQLEAGFKAVAQIPDNPKDFLPNERDLQAVEKIFDGDYRIPLNFRPTAPPAFAFKKTRDVIGSFYYRNPQTKEFCERLEIFDLNRQLCEYNMSYVANPYYIEAEMVAEEKNDSEIVLDDTNLFEDDDDFIIDVKPSRKRPATESLDKEVEEERVKTENDSNVF
ncbi:DBR1 domain-containing protein [Aphelenchoides besseyi]|nr:DBR1 domain-containing protein [Aphelenchoides besseyi]KAI6207521.1 DBR1 domain-containing protein [Aphelenchoides besseyi]